jgi:hypothetical protein
MGEEEPRVFTDRRQGLPPSPWNYETKQSVTVRGSSVKGLQVCKPILAGWLQTGEQPVDALDLPAGKSPSNYYKQE